MMNSELSLREHATSIASAKKKHTSERLKTLSFEEIQALVEELETDKIELEMQNAYLKQTQIERNTHSEAHNKMLFLQSKYASMGETVGNIAHQWKQPLNAIGSIQNSIKATLLFKGEISKEKLLESVETSFKLLEHLGETIDTFYGFLSQKNSSSNSFVLSDEFETIRKITEYSFQNSNIQLVFNLQVNPTIQGNPNEFTHAMLNLILNAKNALDNAKPEAPAINIKVVGEEEKCTILVSDNGGGILIEPVESIFEWHTSSKEESSGVGLYMTKKIIEERFGGTIQVENKDKGACFTLVLPYKTDNKQLIPDEAESRPSLEQVIQLSKKIVELKELERTLQKWADIFQYARWGIAMNVGENHTFEMTNPAFHTLYGYTAQELKTVEVADIFAPESLNILQHIQKEAFEKGYAVFEATHKRKDGSYFPVSVELMVIKDAQGEILYHIANIWDLTEKKKVEERLKLKEFALDKINEAVYLIDEHSMFHYVNEGASHALGYTKEELLTMGVTNIDPNFRLESWQNHLESAKKTGAIFFSTQHKRKDETLFPVEINSCNLEYNGVSYRLATSRDISERILLEEQKDNERMRLFFERQLVGMAITSPQKGWLHTNEKLQQMLGYTHEELTQLTWAELTYPEDLAPDVEQFEKLLRNEIKDYMLEKRFIRKDGALVYTNLAVSCVRNDDSSVNYVLALLEDITERKAQEKALIQKEQKLRALADSSPGMMGSFHMRADNLICMPYVSPNIVDIFGLQPQDVAKDASPLLALTHPDDAKMVEESIALSARTMSIWHEEYRINHPLKGERWMESNTKPELHPEGGIVWYGYIHDITERKQMEKKLKENEAGLKEAQKLAKIGSWELDVASDKLTWSDETYRIFELDSEKVTQLHKIFYESVHPDDKEMVHGLYVESVKNKLPYEMSHRIVMSDGRIKYVLESCETQYNQDGNPVRSIGTVQDITERKLLEKEIADSYHFLNNLIDSIPDPIFVKDREHRWVLLNKANIALTGVDYPMLIGKSDYDIFPKEEADTFWEKDEFVFNSGEVNINEEYFTSADGVTHTIETVKSTFLSTNGEMYLVGTIRDITKRKEAQETIKALNETLELKVKERTFELQQALDFNQGVVNAIPDLMFEVDKEGTYLSVWAKNEELLAAQKEMLLGSKISDILSPEAATICMEAIEESDKNGLSFGKTFKIDLPQGEHWFELSSSKKADGNFLFISRDITERKQAQEEVQKLNSILERRNTQLTMC